jgi:hypothetical protein
VEKVRQFTKSSGAGRIETERNREGKGRERKGGKRGYVPVCEERPMKTPPSPCDVCGSGGEIDAETK